MTAAFAAARAVIQRGIETRAFPAAAVSVGGRSGPAWTEAFGRLTYADDAPPCLPATIFDLASLTKVVATASLAMAQIGAGSLTLGGAVSALLPEWAGDERRAITLRHLLDHSSGLPSRVPGWQLTSGRTGFRELLASTVLERPPGASAVYSDVGFMVLGLLLEESGAPMDRQFGAIFGDRLDPIRFGPLADVRGVAPTEFDPWRGRVLVGEVHDENAAALGGVAGHAGLFGTAESVGAFARLVLQTFDEPTALGSPDLMREFAKKSAVPGSSRGLAWDTALAASSCGRFMSPGAIGHTGFTGTSLWIDEAQDVYAVLLTNRVHPTRTNDQLIPLRRAFHEALLGPG
jgi:CubicO group peptidase (beta-lactamase class C family)